MGEPRGSRRFRQGNLLKWMLTALTTLTILTALVVALIRVL